MSFKLFGFSFGSSSKVEAVDPIDEILAEAKAKAEKAKAKKETEAKIKKDTLDKKAKEAAKEAKAKEAAEKYLNADIALFNAEKSLAKTKEQAVGVMAKAIESRQSAEGATLAKVRAIKAARDAGMSPAEFAKFLVVETETETHVTTPVAVDPIDSLWDEVVAAVEADEVAEVEEVNETEDSEDSDKTEEITISLENDDDLWA